LISVTPFNQVKRASEYWDTSAKKGKKYKYVVLPINRFHVEGLPSKTRKVKRK
jgi:hypothetical protein